MNPLKRSVLIATAFLFALQLSAASAYSAQDSSRPFGLGIILGEPTGLSAKYYLSSRNAIDGGLAYSFNNFIYIFADYLFHFPGAFGGSTRFSSELSPYLGIGAIFLGSTNSGSRNRAYFSDSSGALGMRLPLGIEWSPSEHPIGIFIEVVPGLGIIPGTFGFIEGGIGGRYYF